MINHSLAKHNRPNEHRQKKNDNTRRYRLHITIATFIIKSGGYIIIILLTVVALRHG